MKCIISLVSSESDQQWFGLHVQCQMDGWMKMWTGTNLSQKRIDRQREIVTCYIYYMHVMLWSIYISTALLKMSVYLYYYNEVFVIQTETSESTAAAGAAAATVHKRHVRSSLCQAFTAKGFSLVFPSVSWLLTPIMKILVGKLPWHCEAWGAKTGIGFQS